VNPRAIPSDRAFEITSRKSSAIIL
jgi:hypothetical protein